MARFHEIARIAFFLLIFSFVTTKSEKDPEPKDLSNHGGVLVTVREKIAKFVVYIKKEIEGIQELFENMLDDLHIQPEETVKTTALTDKKIKGDYKAKVPQQLPKTSKVATAKHEKPSTEGDLEQSTPTTGDTKAENDESQKNSEPETGTESTSDETRETNPDTGNSSEEVVLENIEPEPEDLVDDAQLNHDDDLDEILKDVDLVGVNGVDVGLMVVFGANAFPILAGAPYTKEEGILAPIAAAARVEKGRIVAFNHVNFIESVGVEGQGNTDQFILNCVEWASNKKHMKSTTVTGLILGKKVRNNNIYDETVTLPDLLEKNGFEVAYNDPSQSLNLTNVNVLIIPDFFKVQVDEYGGLKTFLEKGGAVVVAVTYAGSRELTGNTFLEETGMIWLPFAVKIAHSVTKYNGSDHFIPDIERLKLTDGYSAVKEIVKHIDTQNVIEEERFAQLDYTLKYNLLNVDHKKLTWLLYLKKKLQYSAPVSLEILNSSKVLGFLTPNRINAKKQAAGGGSWLKDKSIRERDLDQILNGVQLVGVQEANVGIIAVFGKNAFPILAGLPFWGKNTVPVAAAARVGNGKVVAFTHANFIRAIYEENQEDTGKLILNCVEWAATKKRGKSVKFFSKAIYSNDIYDETIRPPEMLKLMGFKSSYSDPTGPLNFTEADVLIIPDFYNVPPTENKNLLSYLKNGGAAIVAMTYAGSREFKGNEFLLEIGMMAVPFATKMAHSLTKDNGSVHFGVEREILKFTDGYSAAQEIIRIANSDATQDVSMLPKIDYVLRYCLTNVDHERLDWLPDLKETLQSLQPVDPTNLHGSVNRKRSKFLAFLKQDLLNEEGDQEAEDGDSLEADTSNGTSKGDSNGNHDKDIDEILDGVKQVGTHDNNVGLLLTFTENAFPILAGSPYGKDQKVPVAGAARFGKGRIVAFNRVHFIKFIDNEDTGDMVKFMLNCVEWASKKEQKATTNIVVQLLIKDFYHPNFDDDYIRIPDMLKIMGYKLSYNDPSEALNLTKVDILIIPDFAIVQYTDYDLFKAFLDKGGAILAGLSFYEGSEFKGNEFLQETGMFWVTYETINARGYIENNGSRYFGGDKDMSKLTSGFLLVQEVMKIIKAGSTDDLERLPQIELILKHILDNVEHSKLSWLSELKKSLNSLEPVIPSNENPVNRTNLLGLQISLESMFYAHVLDPDEIKAHPSSSIFPGAVDEKRISSKPIPVTILITRHGDSQSTQRSAYCTYLYAPPGGKITVEIKGGIQLANFQVKIGLHRDNLGVVEIWKRYPNIYVEASFEGDLAVLTSPFGGLIYIHDIRPRDKNLTLNSITMEIKGAIATPSFILGKTSLKNWKERVRKIDAPWAEFVGNYMALSVPGKLTKAVENPEPLMKFWDNVIVEMAGLAGIAPEDDFQRIIFDYQTAGMYMHSGYPIIAQLYSANSALNFTNVRQPQGMDMYAFFHELGHNHQYLHGGGWTLEGGREITNNIFGFYYNTEILGCDLDDIHPYEILVTNPELARDHINRYIASGMDYKGQFVNEEGNQGYLKFFMYYQLIRKYGWDVFKKMFKGYEELKQYPKTEEEKVDTWIEIFSTAAEENLSDFYKSWGFPFSREVDKRLKKFPYSKMNMKDLLNKKIPPE